MLDKCVALAKQNAKDISRFFKFAGVGALGTAIDFGILNLLILHFGAEKFVANACSFSVAAFSNFIWNRVWSFPESRQRPFLSQMSRFFAVSLTGLAINQAIFLGASYYLFAELGTLGYNLAKSLAVVVVFFWNFIANRLWTYRGI